MLSWRRSGLAALVAVSVLLRHLVPLDSVRLAVVFVVTALAAALWATGMRRARAKARTELEQQVEASHLLIVTIATLLLAAGGLLLSLALA